MKEEGRRKGGKEGQPTKDEKDEGNDGMKLVGGGEKSGGIHFVMMEHMGNLEAIRTECSNSATVEGLMIFAENGCRYIMNVGRDEDGINMINLECKGGKGWTAFLQLEYVDLFKLPNSSGAEKAK
jgi:hypothetical protein